MVSLGASSTIVLRMANPLPSVRDVRSSSRADDDDDDDEGLISVAVGTWELLMLLLLFAGLESLALAPKASDNEDDEGVFASLLSLGLAFSSLPTESMPSYVSIHLLARGGK